MFMMDVLRNLARGRLSELLGGSNANLAMDRAQRMVADYDERELQAMADRLPLLDHDLGTLARNDVIAFVDGVNAYLHDAILDPTKLPAEYLALQIIPKPWKLTDSIALSTLIGGTFSVGGGGQVRNAAFLRQLLESYDGPTARAIFDDMRFANDSEAPVSTDQEFPFNTNLGTPDPAAIAMPDAPPAAAPSFPAYIDGPFGPFTLFGKHAASNALLVDKAHSADGHPMAVFGPQVGYYSPEILMEIDLQGPHVHARGAAFPGISIYALLGRGTNYAWSATTAIGDHTDIRAVKLCEPRGGTPTLKSKGYMRNGRCHRMYERTDSWIAKPSAGGIPDEPSLDSVLVSFTTQRVRLGDPGGRAAGLGRLPIGPDWAIVQSRGTVDGEPVAFVRQRSSYGIEVDATLTFAAIHDPDRVHDIDDLMHAFGDWFSFSFNWHLIDGDDVAFYTTGRYPTLAQGVDPDLPFWGDSRWDWNGLLDFDAHPHAVNPSKGYITNWNNKQAPKFRAADDWWAYGPVGRMQLLADGVDGALSGDGMVSLVELVKAMGNAATRDVRGVYVLPYILQVIGTPSEPDLADAVSDLSSWVTNGSHRRDLDLDGKYDEAAAVALIDALWEPALQAAFKPALGDAYAAMPAIHDDAAGPGGSAYLEGWYGQLQKDLRDVLLGPSNVPDAFSRMYCGAGVLADCQTAMRAALANALAAVKAAYGNDEANWGVTCASGATACRGNIKDADAIQFSAIGVQEQRPMAWQNRPTFQQVLEFAP
jgi:acyl-homoserine lactone acylase PvdQ